jgi:hypothetical protein
MTDGMRTSEFWLTLAAIVAATAGLLLGKIDADLWAVVVTGGSGAYAISRGITKRGSARDGERAHF